MMERKRVYRSDTREAQAARTRAVILESAKNLFQSEGFDRVTIGMIANASDVSPPTIYAIFKSKRGVLQALMDEALSPGEFSTLVEDSMSEKSPVKRLQLTAKLARKIYDAEKELMDVFRGTSMIAPEFRELEQEREGRRYERQGEYVKLLMKDDALAKGVTLSKARDILWTFTGRDIYRMFVIDRGWSSDEYEKWLGQMLASALLT